MKKEIRITIITSLTLLTLLTTCRYKEGPLISFRSFYTRLQGNWRIIEFTSNGTDSLQYYNDSCGSQVYITNTDGFTSDKEFHMLFNYGKSNGFGGDIKFNDKKDIMYIDFLTNQKHIIGPIGYGKSNWKILKLTNKELKTSTDFNGNNYIISFEK